MPLSTTFFNEPIWIQKSLTTTSKSKLTKPAKFQILSDSIPCAEKLGEVLMYKFQRLNFSPEEKQRLSRDMRKEIYWIQNLKKETLEKHAEELIHKLTETKGETITLTASGYGAFVCLTALASGRLPKTKEIHFNLKSAPLILFPKKLSRQNCHRHSNQVSLFLDNQCWMSQFKTLCQVPKHFEWLNKLTVQNHQGITREIPHIDQRAFGS